MAPPISRDDGDWLASLARQSTSTDIPKKPNNASKRKRKGSGGKKNDAGGQSEEASALPSPALTKAQRIERREQKKTQREDRKRLNEEARQQRLIKKRAQKLKHGSQQQQSVAATTKAPSSHRVPEKRGRRGMTALSTRALTQLSTSLDSTVSSIRAVSPSPSQPKRRKKKEQDAASPQESFINGLPAEAKGKATKQSTLRPESKELQPRIRDYNGQGLVRASLYLPFDDPSFVPKLELEFEEHVPGFFGKSKTKAAKKQADSNMLWKRCLKAKEEDVGGGSSSGGGGGKKGKKNKGANDKNKNLEGMIRQGVM